MYNIVHAVEFIISGLCQLINYIVFTTVGARKGDSIILDFHICSYGYIQVQFFFRSPKKQFPVFLYGTDNI